LAFDFKPDLVNAIGASEQMPHQQSRQKQVKVNNSESASMVSSSKFFHPSVKIVTVVAQPLWALPSIQAVFARHRQSTSRIRASAGQLASPAHQSLIVNDEKPPASSPLKAFVRVAFLKIPVLADVVRSMVAKSRLNPMDGTRILCHA